MGESIIRASKEKAGHRKAKAINLLSHRSCDSRFPNARQPIHPIDRPGYIRDRTPQPRHDTMQYLHSGPFKAARGCTGTIRIIAGIRGTRKNPMKEEHLLGLGYWSGE